MDMRTIFILLATVVAFVICTEEESKINKRDTSEEESNLVPESLDEDKRAAKIFRYGRGASIFRYGKRAPAAVFRYGKRGPSIFRYGKRDSDDILDDLVYDDEQLYESPQEWKRLFRWGKRDGDDIKRIFRWGKRSDNEEEEEKRSRIFRYGRSGMDGPHVRDLRNPNQPHVPFRFGDRE